ncbi:hypothetical protein PUW24_20755 [Paenibacillus urinalis]|uniref:Uncharacterized protein n=1 Tax=Paenibacillus urinalis TaxID=521520 RepID=A0AAX3MSZ4_9BACL|nr:MULTISPECIES: hypothetical protein [Paenibacillus]WDH80531.1 hypothetical protein PUW23_13255 [Paenibacillus urinalis]WDH96569.1 hypothetical protein PUW24_20755 [Paenibacillus urinalis]WDI00216.1 hypothetical protein PUW25_12920 [Paenibacillus urinalis]SDX86790.1 hypothetical protein SAMN05518848_12115 [Paenibacillus sp. PDC88]
MMSFKVTEYVNERLEEIEKLKSETFDWLKNVTKTVDELTKEEEIEILEKKMIYYSASGALEELGRLKEKLDE